MAIYIIALVLSAAVLDSCQAFVAGVRSNCAQRGGLIEHDRRFGASSASALSAVVAAAPPCHVVTTIGNVENSEDFDRVVQDGAREKKVRRCLCLFGQPLFLSHQVRYDFNKQQPDGPYFVS